MSGCLKIYLRPFCLSRKKDQKRQGKKMLLTRMPAHARFFAEPAYFLLPIKMIFYLRISIPPSLVVFPRFPFFVFTARNDKFYRYPGAQASAQVLLCLEYLSYFSAGFRCRKSHSIINGSLYAPSQEKCPDSGYWVKPGCAPALVNACIMSSDSNGSTAVSSAP